MKNFLALIILVTLIWVSCQPPSTDTMPEDIEGLKQYLLTKKEEVRALNRQIADAEKKLGELDPATLVIPTTKVTTMPLEKQTFESFIEIQGNVEADDVVMASSEMGGTIISLNAKEGNYIRRGALIAKLNTETLDKQIAEIQTSLDLATTVYEKQKRLWDQEIGTEIQYLQAKNNVERLEKSLETMHSQLKKANVYAPISGVIDQVFLKSGELAGPGAPIIQILNTYKVKVVTAVPEAYLGSVQKNDLVTIKFPALDEELKAKVSLIGRSIDPANRTFNVEVEIPNRQGKYKPNLLSTMLIKEDHVEEAIVLPMHLIQQEVGGKQYVMINGACENGSCAKKVYVTTGPTYDGNIIVETGLVGNEQVILEGARAISENEIIEIVAES